MSFGFSVLVTPGIQLISFLLLTVLLVKRRREVGQFYRETFGQTEEEKDNARQSAQNRFKMKFEKLSDKEIETKLQQDLVQEAIFALNEIKKERKNALQQHL